MAKLYIYVSGPLTTGTENVMASIADAMKIGRELRKMGYGVYIPHLNYFWEVAYPQEWKYEECLEYDADWIDKCDVVYRLPGPSKGADREVNYAISSAIPVVYSLSEARRFLEIEAEAEDEE